jgi:hypothetical protein
MPGINSTVQEVHNNIPFIRKRHTLDIYELGRGLGRAL